MEEQTERIIVSPQPQHKSRITEESIQQTTKATLVVPTIDLGTTSQTHGEEGNVHLVDIPATTSPHLVTHINRSPGTSNDTFSLQLNNVTDEVVRNDLGRDHESVIYLVKETTLDVSSIVVPDDATVDPVLHNEMDFMQTWLAKAVVNDSPFTQLLSKSQKKKLQNGSYQTRSQGPVPPSK